MNAVLKLSVIVSLLMASAGVGYYYAVYLPERDAKLDRERALEAMRAEAERQAAQERMVAQQREAQARKAATKVAAETSYQDCVNAANATHEAAWTAECKRLADKTLENHAGCLSQKKLSQGYCDAAYRTRDPSPHCVLPVAVATAIDGDQEKARRRCLRERDVTLQ